MGYLLATPRLSLKIKYNFSFATKLFILILSGFVRSVLKSELLMLFMGEMLREGVSDAILLSKRVSEPSLNKKLFVRYVSQLPPFIFNYCLFILL